MCGDVKLPRMIIFALTILFSFIIKLRFPEDRPLLQLNFFQVDVTVTSKKGGDKVKDFLRHEGTKMIQDKMGEYIAALKKGELLVQYAPCIF